MKSMVICEGYTDCVLLQYFLRKAYGWQDGGGDKNLENRFKPVRVLKKTNDTVKIGGCGGCTEIKDKLSFVLDMNHISAETEPEFDRIVILTDRDEWNTEQKLVHEIMDVLSENHVKVNRIENNQWCNGTYYNGRRKELQVKLLLLVIPFTGTGALETFLLESVARDHPYDAEIISQCNRFVDHIDPEKKYLRQRRHVTKAKFNVYFAVRAAEEQFVERQNVLLSVPWEQYSKMQEDFEKLGELSEKV